MWAYEKSKYSLNSLQKHSQKICISKNCSLRAMPISDDMHSSLATPSISFHIVYTVASIFHFDILTSHNHKVRNTNHQCFNNKCWWTKINIVWTSAEIFSKSTSVTTRSMFVHAYTYIYIIATPFSLSLISYPYM